MSDTLDFKMTQPDPQDAVLVSDISHRYGDRLALDRVDFAVKPGEVFGLLGPNGGGKTTLFRILSTLLAPTSGKVEIFGFDPAIAAEQVRRRIGVVFQSFSLDKILTVEENLYHQGRLYGLWGADLTVRIAHRLDRVGLLDRRRDRVGTLSGGMQRRVEVAKGLLHEPELLILDEPSTGLDPGARLDLWRYLRELQRQEGTTVLMTTHLMEEAEKCDRLAILSQGRLVAMGSPEELKKQIGGEVLSLQTGEVDRVSALLQERLGLSSKKLPGLVRIEDIDGPEWLARVAGAVGEIVDTMTLGKPTLEDVFIHHTGHRFWDEETAP